MRLTYCNRNSILSFVGCQRPRKVITHKNGKMWAITLFKCVFSYYEYLWLRNKGVDASSLFEGLPLCLQADITLSLYKDLIERVKGLLSLFAFSLYFSIVWGVISFVTRRVCGLLTL